MGSTKSLFLVASLTLLICSCSGSAKLGDRKKPIDLLTISSCENYMASVFPNLARFEKTIVGNTSTPITMTVANTGSSSLTLDSIDVPSPFSASGINPPATIQSEEEITFDLEFNPSSAQVYSDQMVLHFSELSEDKEVDLWGTGLSSIPALSIVPDVNSNYQVSQPLVLDQAGATYQLDGDLTCSRTCFSIQAQNITLDLGGHTITYATQSGSSRAYGVLFADGWVTADIGDNPKGGNARGFHIRNGKIIQGAQATDMNHALFFHYGGGSANYTLIEDLEVEVTSLKSHALFAIEHGGFVIRNSYFESFMVDSEEINRHQLEGYIIKFEGSPYRNIIAGNTVTGGVQGGIIAAAPYSQIYQNEVTHEGHLANDFGIGGSGKYSEVFQNTVAPPLSGRGIFANDEAAIIRNNIINVTEYPWNREYAEEGEDFGCQGQGAFGIQLEGEYVSEPDGSYIQIFGNDVLARADDCDAKALRITGGIRDNLICNNTFQALREADSQADAISASFSNVHQTDFDSVTLTDNVLEADGNNVRIEWEGSENIKFYNNLILKGDNPDSEYSTIYFGNVDPGSGLLFADSTFENGASYESYRMLTQGNGVEDPDSQEFFVAWTVKITVRDGSDTGPLIDGATVKIEEKNGSGDSDFTQSGLTSEGEYSVLLRKYRRYNTFSSPSDVENFTPHLITVSASGFADKIETHSIIENDEITIVMEH